MAHEQTDRVAFHTPLRFLAGSLCSTGKRIVVTNIKNLLLIITLVVVMSCGVNQRNDVYLELPKGTKINIDLLKRADQIVISDKEVILIYNTCKDGEFYNPHLMFFDKDMELYSAAYFASEKIESISNGVIKGYKNELRASRINAFQYEIPDKYSIDLITRRDNGSGNIANKVIESIYIDSTDLTLRISIRTSKDLHSISHEYLRDNLDLSLELPIKDTLEFELTDLKLDYRNGKISSRSMQDKGKTWDHMLIIDKKLLDDFYDNLFRKLKSATQH